MDTPNAAEVPPRSRWWLRGLIAAAALLVVAGAVVVKVYKPARLAGDRTGQTVGAEPAFGIKETGFYDPEQSKPLGKFRWTNGAAKLVIPVEKSPRVLYVRASYKRPQPGRLAVTVNGHPVYDQTTDPQDDWSRSFDLAGHQLGRVVTVELLSDTFVPAEVNPKNTDRRKLGVCLRDLKLLSDEDFVGRPLGVAPVPGVDEAGFYPAETSANTGQPFRWTTGNARLSVPLGAKPPKALSLDLEIPNAEKPTLKVRVNGTTLVDETPKPRAHWKRDLPLGGVNLGGRVAIEIDSATSDPSPARSDRKDSRKLGARVNRLVLVPAD